MRLDHRWPPQIPGIRQLYCFQSRIDCAAMQRLLNSTLNSTGNYPSGSVTHEGRTLPRKTTSTAQYLRHRLAPVESTLGQDLRCSRCQNLMSPCSGEEGQDGREKQCEDKQHANAHGVLLTVHHTVGCGVDEMVQQIDWQDQEKQDRECDDYIGEELNAAFGVVYHIIVACLSGGLWRAEDSLLCPISMYIRVRDVEVSPTWRNGNGLCSSLSVRSIPLSSQACSLPGRKVTRSSLCVIHDASAPRTAWLWCR